MPRFVSAELLWRLPSLPLDAGPVVLLGDFNSRSYWDRLYPKDRNHTALVGRLHTLGLTSSYHFYFGEARGSETAPTFFEYRHRQRPYDIDYCFVLTGSTSGLTSVCLGTHEDWSRQSDHMPLLTTFRPPAS
jgi:endonuclease/exonuclease/phosphatase family metal-dependent hydrolase